MAKRQMIVAQAGPSIPSPICYLLDKLPAEVRLYIYKYYCEGSKVKAFLANNGAPHVEKTGHLVLKSSEHLNLLLTCRAIYHEALDTYWAKTVLKLKYAGHLISADALPFDFMTVNLDTYTHRLCAALPKAARANVRHVRGMELPGLTSTWVRNNPGRDAAALLATFKRLESCEITRTLARPISYQVQHHEDLEDENYSRFSMGSGAAPSAFLSKRYGMTNFDEVAFILKAALKRTVRFGSDVRVESHGETILSPVYHNFSTGFAFVDITEEMDEEECYKKILQFEE